MSEQGCEQLTLFPVDSHASRSASPGSTAARTMTVTSGRRCYALYGSYARLGSLVRMCLESSVWHSTRCFLTWKARGTKRSRLLFQLVASTPPTEEIESPLLPTLLANGMGSEGSQMMLIRMVEKGLMTQEEFRAMRMGNGGKINPDWAEWLMGYAQQFTKLIPTVRASDYKGSPVNRYWTQTVHVEREREHTADSCKS